jgi:hypothetical protein
MLPVTTKRPELSQDIGNCCRELQLHKVVFCKHPSCYFAQEDRKESLNQILCYLLNKETVFFKTKISLFKYLLTYIPNKFKIKTTLTVSHTINHCLNILSPIKKYAQTTPPVSGWNFLIF